MRATTCATPNVSRATRAEMMLELSPLLTAANAPARSIPARPSVARSKPIPVICSPEKSAPSRRKAAGFWSMIDTVCPVRSRLRARLEPTRPQPITTMCTVADATPGPGSRRRRVGGLFARPYDRARVAADEGHQAPGDRAAGEQRSARRDHAVQADRAADLRQRRAVLGDVRDAGDPADADRRRDRVPLPHALGGGRHRAALRDRGGVLPAGGPGVPVR